VTSAPESPTLSWRARVREELATVERALNDVVVGQESVVSQVLVGVDRGGHSLLEGVPGLGKTLLVRTLGQVTGLTFGRVQFTPDLMPATSPARRSLTAIPVSSGSPPAGLHESAPGRRNQPRTPRTKRIAGSDAGAHRNAAGTHIRCRSRSSSWRRRIHLKWKAPIHYPKRSSTGSCSRCWCRSVQRGPGANWTADDGPSQANPKRELEASDLSQAIALSRHVVVAPHVMTTP